MIAHELRQDGVILVCSEGHCKKNGCKKVCERLKQALQDEGLKGDIRVQRSKCLGHCKKGPNVLVCPTRTLYSGVKHKEDVAQIIAELGLAGVCA